MDELHHNVEHPIDISEVVNGDEVGMVEAGHSLCLSLEGCPELGVVAKYAREYFNGDGAVQ